jgi:hypothetical protein
MLFYFTWNGMAPSTMRAERLTWLADFTFPSAEPHRQGFIAALKEGRLPVSLDPATPLPSEWRHFCATLEPDLLSASAELLGEFARLIEESRGPHGDSAALPLRGAGALDSPNYPNDGTNLSIPDLAGLFKVNEGSLRRALGQQWRNAHHNNDWQEVPHPRPRDPKFLYRVGSVRPVIEQLTRAASARRSKKTR